MRSRTKNKKLASVKNGLSTAAWVLVVVVTVITAAAGIAYVQRQRRGREALSRIDVVKIETDRGLVVMEVYPKLMPITVPNFEGLAKSGFYDGLTWHRVEDWVIQTGDPQGTGHGGSDKTIKLEVSPELKNVRGAVGMARSQDPDSASSQFYILKRDAARLDGQYAVFGKVVSGMDVVDQIQKGDKMPKVTVEPGQPGKQPASPKWAWPSACKWTLP